MFLKQIIVSIFIFFAGVFGIVVNQKNVLIIIMCIELILLSINLNFILCSIYLDDAYGQIFALFILTVAAAESALGLAILIIYYRIRGNIFINKNALLKN